MQWPEGGGAPHPAAPLLSGQLTARKTTAPQTLQSVWQGISNKEEGSTVGAKHAAAGCNKTLATLDSANMYEGVAANANAAKLMDSPHSKGRGYGSEATGSPKLRQITCPGYSREEALPPSPPTTDSAGMHSKKGWKRAKPLSLLLKRMVCCGASSVPREPLRDRSSFSLPELDGGQAALPDRRISISRTMNAEFVEPVPAPTRPIRIRVDSSHEEDTSDGEQDDFWDARSFASNSSFRSTTPCSPGAFPDLGSLSGQAAEPAPAPSNALASSTSPNAERPGAPMSSLRDAYNMLQRTITPQQRRPSVTVRKHSLPPIPLPAGAVMPSGERPYWVPDAPLPLLDPSTRFIPMPQRTAGYEGYWSKVASESSPTPMPIDVMLGANYIARKAHESIKGIKITEDADQLCMHAKITVMGMTHIHCEVYKKDGSISGSRMRRDVKPGRMEFQGFYTESHQLVFVVHSYAMGCTEPDAMGMEVITLVEEGSKINCYQGCFSGGKSATQLMVAKRMPLPSKIDL